MSKVNIPFDFTTPISTDKLYGELTISGIAYGLDDENKPVFDFNEIIYKRYEDVLLGRPGYNIIDLIKVMHYNDVHECEMIEIPTIAHVEKVLAGLITRYDDINQDREAA